MTVCKCIKKSNVTFALTTILLTLFIEDYYSKHKISSQISEFFKSKLLIKNTHIGPHQQRPNILQEQQQLFKQLTLNHQHESLFETIHTHLEKDTHDCPNH